MSSKYKVTDNIKWDSIMKSGTLKIDDFMVIGDIVIKGIIYRIISGKVASGQALNQNSPFWKAFKENNDFLTQPLQMTGGLTQEKTYRLRMKQEGHLILELKPHYHDIHFDLNEISRKTGKNYSEFFGMSEKDIEEILEYAFEAVLFNIKNG